MKHIDLQHVKQLKHVVMSREDFINQVNEASLVSGILCSVTSVRPQGRAILRVHGSYLHVPLRKVCSLTFDRGFIYICSSDDIFVKIFESFMQVII